MMQESKINESLEDMAAGYANANSKIKLSVELICNSDRTSWDWESI